MRHETCLACRATQAEERSLHVLTVIAESISGTVHHHHKISCEGCGAWWFDDCVVGGLGILVPARRDTVLCECDESLQQYPRGIVMVSVPESECRCTASDVDKHGLPIRLGRQ